MALLKKTITLLSFLLVSFSFAFGQEVLRVGATASSVQTQVTVIPPYPFHFQGLIRQQGNAVLLQNLSGNSLQLKLHFKMVSVDGNVSIETKPGTRGNQPINLGPHASLRLGFAQLGEILSPQQLIVSGMRSEDLWSSQPMPEGYYQVCVTPESYTGQNALGSEACSVTFPMMSLEPPILRLTNLVVNDTVQQVTPQNLIFQWNIPSNLNMGLLGSIKTTLKLVEVPKGMMPEQAILNAPYYSPKFEVKGQTLFVYGPTQSPLIKGRRYAAVVQLTDPQNRVSFRNNGTSEVISFVFGRPSTNNAETGLAYKIYGRVDWAYKASQEQTVTDNNTPLVASEPLPESRNESIVAMQAGKTKYPLGNAQVIIYGTNEADIHAIPYADKSAIGTAKTDENGQYTLSLVLENAMKKFKYLYLEVYHASGLFSKQMQVFNYSSLQDGTVLQPITLLGNNIRFTPRVLLADRTLQPKVTMNLLLPATQWQKYAPATAAGLGVNETLIQYNNQAYVVVATLKSGQTFSKLFQTTHPNDHYLVQINHPNRPSAYYPLGNCYVDAAVGQSEKPVLEIAKNYVYDNTNQLSGRITHKGVGRNDVRVSLQFNAADVVGGYLPEQSLMTTTDNEGYYAIKQIPILKEGATLAVLVTDRALSQVDFQENIRIKKSVDLVKDIDLVVAKTTIKGRVVDELNQPISNALVMLSGSSNTTRTQEDGSFALELETAVLNQHLQLLADGYEDKLVNIASITTKATKLERSALITPLQTINLKAIPNNSTLSIQVEKLADASTITKGALTITPLSNPSKKIKVSLAHVGGNPYQLSVGNELDPYGYDIRYTPAKADQETMAATSVQVNLAKNQHSQVVLKAGATVVISGIVKDGLSSLPITQQLISAIMPDTTTYSTLTDKSGRFQLIVPASLAVKLQLNRTGYLFYDTTIAARITNLAVTVVLKTSVGQTFTTLAGFPVKISKIAASGSNFIISGSLTLSNNATYNLTSSNTLTFTSAKVSVDGSTTNAKPLNDSIYLSTSGLTFNALGFAPIEATPGTIRIKSDGGNYSKGIIAAKLMLKPTRLTTTTFQLPTAPLVDRYYRTDSLNTAFAFADSSKTVPTNYSLFFGNNNTFRSSYLLNNDTLKLDTAYLSTSGISKVKGFLQLGSKLGFTADSSGKVTIKTAAFNTKFGIQTLSFFTGNTVLSAAVQKIRATYTDVILSGIGTSNPSMTLVGNLNLIRSGSLLPFNQMGITNTGSGYALSASFELTKAVSIGALSFAIQNTGTRASFSYSGANNTYNLNYALSLNIDAVAGIASIPAVSQITKAIFESPIGGQFTLQTSNFGVFVAATANQTIKFGVAEITLNSFLLNVGTNANLESMDSIIQGTKLASSPIVGDTTQITSATAFWAFGISGEVAFASVKSLSGTGPGNGGGGIVLVANTATGFAARVDTLYLNLQTSTVEFSAGLSLQFDNTRRGFSGVIKMTMVGMGGAAKGLDATFKYYKYSAGGMEMGASILIKADVSIGPVTFHTFGGGFDLNTVTKEYNVFLNGSLGPVKVPASLINVEVYLNVLFSSACNYVPIVTGTGDLVVGKVFTAAKVSTTLDFCNKYVLISMVRNIPIPNPIGSATINTVLFIAAPVKGFSTGAFFMAADMVADVAYVLNNVNAGLGVGYNILSSNPYIPATFQTALAKYWGTGYLNGLYMYGEFSQSSNGDYGFSFASVVGAHLKWNQSVVFGMKFTADIPTATVNLGANFAAHVDGNAGVSIAGFNFGIGGLCDIGFNANGGYSPSTGFNLVGSGGASLQVYGGVGSSGENRGCNSVNIDWDEECFDAGFFDVCVPYPSGASAKACFNLGFKFGVQSGKSPYCSFNF